MSELTKQEPIGPLDLGTELVDASISVQGGVVWEAPPAESNRAEALTSAIRDAFADNTMGPVKVELPAKAPVEVTK